MDVIVDLCKDTVLSIKNSLINFHFTSTVFNICSLQVSNLENDLEDARSRANITIMDVTTTSEERLSTLQEDVISLTTKKVIVINCLFNHSA